MKGLSKKSKYLFLVLFLFCLVYFCLKYIEKLPSPWNNSLEYSTKVIDRNGEILRLFTTSKGYWRFSANQLSIDNNFIKALINYEDRRFYQHFGVDFWAIARAIKQLILHTSIVSGASTISMQTIRLLNPQPRTVANKILEIIQAIRMESELSKEQILSLYLSLAPYGGNIQGLEAACYFYFGKTARHLSNSEIALLIALPQSPEIRRPDRNIKNAYKARNEVLSRLLNRQLIDVDDYKIAHLQEILNKRIETPFHAVHLSQRLHQIYPNKGIISYY